MSSYKLLSKPFPANKVLLSMEYKGDTLKILFKKGQIRAYWGVPSSVAYGLFYKTSAAESLAYYANEIKGKFEVIQVKQF